MSTVVTGQQSISKIKAYGLVDGFNMYNALETFERGVNEADRGRYRKYKWLCLRTLIHSFIRDDSEELVGVHYFTAYPNWDNAKRLRHQAYVSALRERGVEYTLGEFKSKTVECRAACKQPFMVNEEKQTDVNIATKMLDVADSYDKLILLTADSDQVPAVRLIRKRYPEKQIFILPPIGRNSKELVQAAGNRLVMTEQHLQNSLLPNPLDIVRNGKVTAQLWKPASWPVPS